MESFFRKARGIVSIAATWAFLWAALGLVLWLAGTAWPGLLGLAIGLPLIAAIFGISGFLAGIGFGVGLALGESKSELRDLSLGRAAFWGALGAAVPPILMGVPFWSILLYTCPLGAACGAASLAIARRAVREPQLVEDGILVDEQTTP